ncbi:hypothetical protein ACIGW0_31465 [Streptomyces bikiniensis]|uniref:Uncharacterized protein n=1 Tax=Streptomyces bikiniensis TaxID=1896 RepID=A0ABW8D5P6_STRBI
MNARDVLLDLLYGERPAALTEAYSAGEWPEREKDVDIILAMHAHELAERIRDEMANHSDHTYAAGLYAGAQIIDPEAN